MTFRIPTFALPVLLVAVHLAHTLLGIPAEGIENCLLCMAQERREP